MTGLINWFKTIFILEITGEIALKLVPPKYKEFIAFVMKLIPLNKHQLKENKEYFLIV